MAIFPGPQAYISPSWYVEAGERRGRTDLELSRGACLRVDFFDDADRLLEVVTRVTDAHDHSAGKDRRAVSDAPADFIKAQLKGIVGPRLQITRLEGTRKMSQNRNAADRAGVIEGLSKSDRDESRRVAHLIPNGITNRTTGCKRSLIT
ncbi:hypothetical protein BSZ21_05675 [Bradyrhizobium canariense]|uniref:FMN-binding negative transcriptional regulator n=1 Tax=Bradyrhizobium canariense TaxID=255045 RepID=UPI000A19023F|nr:hypothetical protein BSZ21_05675 [Bradyrhizobium canariense]